MAELALPIVDFGAFDRDEGIVIGAEPTAAQLAAAEALDAACRAHGFVVLKNVGVAQGTLDAAFGASKRLFSLDDASKRAKLAPISPETNRGYSAMASETTNMRRAPDVKEAFNVRSSKCYTNDYRGCPSDFGPAAGALWAACARIRERHTYLCALALGLPRDYFAQHFSKDELTTLRFLRYPACDVPDPAAPYTACRIGEHTDFGLFTLLFVNEPRSAGSRGLQLKPVVASDDVNDPTAQGWKFVSLRDCPEDEVVCIVNTGGLLARWTNDEWRATAHRVIVPDEAVASRERYSIAFFVDPDGDAEVEAHPKFIQPGAKAKYPKTTSLEYLLDKLRGTQQSMPDKEAASSSSTAPS